GWVMTVCIIITLVFLLSTAAMLTMFQSPEPQTFRPTDWQTGRPTDIPLQIASYGDIIISPPHSYKNMTLFIISKPQEATPEQDMLTLAEGLEQKSVKVSEKEQAEVQKLYIENNSDKPLFIQVGDVIKGGKQDRTIQVSLIIPPHSDKVEIPSLCVEQGRWSGRSGYFDTIAPACAPTKELRMGVQTGSQSYVWEKAAEYKSNVRTAFGLQLSTTTSINEEMETPVIQKSSAEYEKAFADLLKDYPQSIGIAYVLNGEINTIDLYHSNKLFQRLYPKLLKTYANESVISESKDQTETVTAENIKEFITQMEKGTGTKEQVYDNEIVRLQNDAGITSDLRDRANNSVHRQYIKK
ncbi:MAG: hypothetical protein QME51_06915, partial [Planctomycetota bacterium]|nr:hypothetical protein [Planctomycetota bacterium]